ncbi:glucose-6-phosphate isomerase [Methanomicrobium antiquum]|uniref:glucose-6-phosphate isomerase n=1 Tax=Methanomicrobium antiquum TaxID=487686 RepID=A0AAF0FUQ6_9EURY|nr:glucose-6-phosphate isomerase family protein [Methanomicrobium antiquum]MDD3977103.1 glucose-6-phosphate isomerase family protein [Methanomicrobium sp.]WFN36848.1 glucose-6-phosphate isomerase [Methanomicrobium antiquum]
MNKFWDGPLPKPNERTVEDMQCVLAESSLPAENKTLYFMYRNLSKNEEDSMWLSNNNLRFDITVIPPGVIGDEFVKTKGHYHPEAPCGLGYPEIYQVLKGKAHFLLQKKDILDICVIKAEKGDIVLIKPGYGHVTINPSDETLVMANIVSDNFESEYGNYIKMHGAAYYEFKDKGFVKNLHYKNIPEIKIINASQCEIPGISEKGKNKSLYSFIGEEKVLDFLNNPSLLE